MRKTAKSNQTRNYVYVLYQDINVVSLKQLHLDFEKQNVKDIDTLYLVLCSNGGSPACAFELAYYLNGIAQKIIGMIPSFAYSSSSLLALSFDEIHLGSFGFLGPMDTQAPYYDAEKGYNYHSMENIDACCHAIIDYGIKAMDKSVRMILKQTDLNASDSIKLSKGMIESMIHPILNKIDPNTLGNYHRASDLASMYGVRILTDIMGIDINLAWGICEGMTKGYPTHGFHIKKSELKKIGLPIVEVSKQELKGLDRLKFRLEDLEPFQGFSEWGNKYSMIDKIAA